MGKEASELTDLTEQGIESLSLVFLNYGTECNSMTYPVLGKMILTIHLV